MDKKQAIATHGILLTQLRYASNNQLKIENLEFEDPNKSVFYKNAQAARDPDYAQTLLAESLGNYTLNREAQEAKRLYTRPARIFTAPRFKLGTTLQDPMVMNADLRRGNIWLNPLPLMKPSTLPVFTGHNGKHLPM